MATQFVTDENGKRTSVIISIEDYENLLHQHQRDLELTDDYKKMMDEMLLKEDDGTATYVSADHIKSKFMPK